jgi:predicted dehydrogenase
MVHRPDVDIVDVSAPQYLHYDITMEALRAGKHVFCEKPLAMNAQQAKEMYELAEKQGVTHYINHNYRRSPAVRLAKRLIDDGKVGRIFHWRGCYLQSWIVDPQFPLTWHLQKQFAGSGPQGDLNSHSVDLARYLVGDIRKVTGMTANFITERPLPDEAASGTFSGKVKGGTGKVTVEDAAFMIVEFANGALGSFEATRFAPGRKNYNYFEIYGSKGSILFDLERMNELKFFSQDDPANAQGFRTILATEGGQHDYIANWWPPGHVIGYEHEFVHAVVDFVDAVVHKKKIEPDFRDGWKELEVLEAGLKSAETGKAVELA